MITSSRRQFLAQSAGLLALGANGFRQHLRHRRDGTERQVRPRHQRRRGARSEPEPQGRARRRHPLRRDRGTGGEHPGRESAEGLERVRQARDTGPHRPARPRLSLRLRHRHPCGRARSRSKQRRPCVSAGDAGANNIAAFRRAIVGQTRARLYAFVHIANIGLAGFPVPELYNIDYAQTDAAAKAVAENADLVLGIKVRMSENVIAKHGLEPLKRAIQACTMAGTGAKVMCHIGGVETPS